jgi:hypothetical protein
MMALNGAEHVPLANQAFAVGMESLDIPKYQKANPQMPVHILLIFLMQASRLGGYAKRIEKLWWQAEIKNP